MIKVNIADAKSRLSEYLKNVERGETVILCRRNVPIAELRPLPRQLTEPRMVGTDPDLVVPNSFFEPLPEDLLAAFEGSSATDRSEPSRQEGGDPFEQLKRQWTNRLRAFYDQRNHPSHYESLVTLSDLIAHIQTPGSAEQGALVMSAEKKIMMAS